ncbi:N-acetylglucosamine-6-phosphate deacetylase [Oceanomicrobium pacificus]|uniref:N-acetylglucosamine-6-phosphate deacetylase n=1 Tax=Oceanomicrobium pacificus TaxID=2692916 RepID=A0A6B0TZA2_9RHOB|nr:N-acetylglucosamine-6-phosphate deacetylase [Oceanomicrobium pacificus]MXU66738.1 N-acetylglucosamine-6-phosphate deacetylase [Oceanomicrobium pacificus]
MSAPRAFRAARLFDGTAWHDDALVVTEGAALLYAGAARHAPSDLRDGLRAEDLGQGWLVPGFVDLQVNGGGGVLLNDDPSVDTIARICAAHAPFGSTSLLPTLITDTPEKTAQAIAAGRAAARAAVPGFAGLHLEGPHLDPARKGAHDARYIRPMSEDDCAALEAAAADLPALLVTLAPESASPDQIRRLTQAGATVSLGHSATSCTAARRSIEAGARSVTHLFNAMSGLGHREPGLVGAALASGDVSAGIIADGIHVDPVALGVALRAKTGPGALYLVTDAMATIGTDMTEFTLDGRRILRRDGRLTLEDGTLAGADLDMISAVRFMVREMGLDAAEALAMAGRVPAGLIGDGAGRGHLVPGGRADMLLLSDDLQVERVWIGGAVSV